MPPWTDTSKVTHYTVLDSIDNVTESVVAPWGHSNGKGIQYLLPETIDFLRSLGKIIEEIR